MTPITAAALLACGYREFPRGPIDSEHISRLFQKAFDDAKGRKYFITFREWPPLGAKRCATYDAQIACNTKTGGYLWATIREISIEETESQMAAIWETVGMYYEEKP